VVRQDNSVGTGKIRRHLVVTDETVDKCDPAMAALFDEPDRQVPALPRLAHDGEPIARHLVVIEHFEGPDEVLEALVGANDAEEQEVERAARSLAQPDRRRAAIGSPRRVVIVRPLGDYDAQPIS
jgi:hypothetical protein